MIQAIQTGKKSGFSLLELLVVVGIIAALVGLAMPYYSDYVNQSKYAIMRSNLHTLKRALMEYKNDKDEFPATADLEKKLVPKYLMDLPVDPVAGAIATWGYIADAASCSFHSDYAPYFSAGEVIGVRPVMKLRP